MTSEDAPIFVWAWLPDQAEPVVAGRLDRRGRVLLFTYGRSYLERGEAIPLYLPELPLGNRQLAPLTPGEAAGCILDGAPDGWGQRVILNREVGRDAKDPATLDLGVYLLRSGSNRIGALDFQASAGEYVPRSIDGASLNELTESAQRVEDGVPLSDALDRALLAGSSAGGARPKALLTDGPRQLLAKFASSEDNFAVVKGEFVAMTLAARAGLDVAPVTLTQAMGKDVLLVDRFDRPEGGGRRVVVSALTILGLAAQEGRYASYARLASIVRARFTDPKETLRELFARITFNILTGNTDDHARNHAAFWDGEMLTLTPAYDICPQRRAGQEAAQIMGIGEDGWRMSQLAGCIERSHVYGLTPAQAREITDHQIRTIERDWTELCEQAEVSAVDRRLFWEGMFFNPYAFYGY